MAADVDPKFLQFTEYGGPQPVATPVDLKGQPRGDAVFPVPHKAEFSGLSTNPARSYLATFDEAMWSNRENAYRCRLDPVVDSCMRLRTYPTALLSHHIVPDDDENEVEVQCAARAEKLLKWLPQFVFMKRWLLNDGDWVGRSALKTRWQWVYKQGRTWMVPTAFEPVSGDKLVFKLDGRVGIRVGGLFTDTTGQVESADWSRVYFLNPQEREQLVVHHFEPTDQDFFRPQMAGAIKGLGLRNIIYWLWALKIRVWVRPNSPRAVGRHAVRFMRASMPCSIRQLKAAAAPATNQMPMQAATARTPSSAVGTPGTASSMPMTAQKTMSCTTRGLVSA